MLYEAVQQMGELQVRDRGRLSSELNAALDEGREIDATAYAAALARRDVLIAAATEWLAPFDAIASPAGAGRRAGRSHARPAIRRVARSGRCSAFPPSAIPIAAAANGLPLGLQLAAIAGADDRLLAVAQWCEARLPFAGLV